jgi:predicted glutamine amidotransferase
MCGIVGVVYGPDGPGVEKWTPSEAAELMFPNVVHRGRHAWGWVHNLDNEKFQLRKWGEEATDENIKKLRNDHELGIPDDSLFWIGHVRHATHGPETVMVNNHPIIHGDWVGVHNGIVYNYREILKKTGRQHKKAEVDSEAIFAAIDKYGLDDGLKQLDALAAFVTFDRKDPETVYFGTTNPANPLIIAQSKGGAWYFASELHILEFLDMEWAEQPFILKDSELFILNKGLEYDYRKYEGYKHTYYNSSFNSGSLYNRKLWWMEDDDEVLFESESDAAAAANEYLKNHAELQCCLCAWEGDDGDLGLGGDCPQCQAPFECLIDISSNRLLLDEIEEKEDRPDGVEHLEHEGLKFSKVIENGKVYFLADSGELMDEARFKTYLEVRALFERSPDTDDESIRITASKAIEGYKGGDDELVVSD